MAGLEGRDDAFGAAQVMERIQGFLVGNADVFGTANVFEESVLRAYAWIVQARADAVRFCNLTIVVLQDVRTVAVQHTGATALQRGRVLATF